MNKNIGHQGWVTCLATTADSSCLISGSRDKSIIIWKIVQDQDNYALPQTRLNGYY